jgi:hypothetical protein
MMKKVVKHKRELNKLTYYSKITLNKFARDYQMVSILTKVLKGNFLLLSLQLGCTTNQRNTDFGYLQHLLIQGHQGHLLCFLESS